MIRTVHLSCFLKHAEFTGALSKGKTILSFGGGVDRRGLVRVYLEIEKPKAANLCLQGKPRGAGQGEVTCQVPHSPKVIHVKKKAELFLPKTWSPLQSTLLAKPSIPVTMQSTLDCCHGNRQLGVWISSRPASAERTNSVGASPRG